MENSQQHLVSGTSPRDVPIDELQKLLELRYTAPAIAKKFSVSLSTIRRRMKEHNLQVKSMYTDISDTDLYQILASLLVLHPHTGYKRMRSLLWTYSSIRITDARLQASMKVVDEKGVLQRKMANRAIVRRVYFVKYSNQLWHMDTNMKLNRYKMIIRGAIDGKSRLSVFLDIGDNNTAVSTLDSFMNAVRAYNVPQMVRTDKGGENVRVSRFMIIVRGLQGHITGKSVHNQRIERYWGDVYRDTGFFYDTFVKMEYDGVLNIDDSNHLFILHYVYLPRIQRILNNARHAWNCHSLSSEHNHSPERLMLDYAAPSDHDVLQTKGQLEDIYEECRTYDCHLPDTDDQVRNPTRFRHTLTSETLTLLQHVDVLRPSLRNGRDIFEECLTLIS